MKCILLWTGQAIGNNGGEREPERAFGRNLAHTQPIMETMARNNTTAHFCEQCSLYDRPAAWLLEEGPAPLFNPTLAVR